MIALALEDAGLKCTLHGSDTFIAECVGAALHAVLCGPLQALVATLEAARGADYRDRIRPMQGLDLPKRPLLDGHAKKFIHLLYGLAAAHAHITPTERKRPVFMGLLRVALI